jgi:hypothetical protein
MNRPAPLLLAFAIAAAASVPVRAQDGVWKDRFGRPVTQTDSRRSLDGLGGWVVVTPDADWREKWNKPTVLGPTFNKARTVEKGKKIYVLIFLGNPQLGAQGEASVTCDLDVTDPAGTNAVHRTTVCFKGIPGGPPNSVYLSSAVLEFTGEPADPSGTWTVQVALHDNVRHAVLPLKASFVLE